MQPRTIIASIEKIQLIHQPENGLYQLIPNYPYHVQNHDFPTIEYIIDLTEKLPAEDTKINTG
jgi:hypothetical protein